MDNLTSEPAVLTVAQAAALLQLSTNTMYALIGQNAVPHVRFGKLIRIPCWGLLQYIARESGAPFVDDRQVAIPSIQSVHVEQSTAKMEG